MSDTTHQRIADAVLAALGPASPFGPAQKSFRFVALRDRKSIFCIAGNQYGVGECMRRATGCQWTNTLVPTGNSGNSFLGMLALLERIEEDGRVIDRVVGFLFVQQHVVRSMFYIGNLVVLPDYRRQGVASSLLKVAEHWIKSENWASVIQLNLDNPDRDTWLQAFYEKNGYAVALPGQTVHFDAVTRIEFPMLKIVQ